jgi:hypothetical protein
MADYRLRFTGRFAFISKYRQGTKTALQVDVLGMNMAFNGDLGSTAHATYLAISREQVQPFGILPAHFSTFAPSRHATGADQLLVWSLDGYDVSFSGAQVAPLELKEWEKVPDLNLLDSSTHFNKALLDAQLPANGPVSARVNFTTGTFGWEQFDLPKRVSFEPLITQEPKGPFLAMLPDLVNVDLKGTMNAPFAISLRRRSDGTKGSIVVVPSDVDPLVITVSNVCSRPSHEDDREFAAYYDVLHDPKQCLERLIPFVSRERTMGARTDCTGVAQASYEG